MMLNKDGKNYLIIGGTTKAATTSIFSYFSNHPQVCASSIKETRFFLDSDYPVISKYRYEDGLEKYQEFYIHCKQNFKFRLEATPDYLYSKNTAYKISNSLPNSLLVFILIFFTIEELKPRSNDAFISLTLTPNCRP